MVSESLEPWHIAAHSTARQVTMFPQANVMFAHGLAIQGTEEQGSSDENLYVVVYIAHDYTPNLYMRLSRSTAEIQEFKYQCEQYMKIMPHLKDVLDFLLLNPNALVAYGKYVCISLSLLY